MGHIELAAPVTHIWYFKGVPSPAGLPARPGPEGPREDHLLRGLPDHQRRRRGAPPRPARPSRPRSAPRSGTLEKQPRRRHRRPGQEARGRPGRARGRGRQERTSGARSARAASARCARSATGPSARSTVSTRSSTPSASSTSKQLISDELLYRELRDRFGEYFEGGMGAEALQTLVAELRPRRRGRAPARDDPQRQGPEEAPGAQAAQGRGVVPVRPPTRRWAWCSTACRSSRRTCARWCSSTVAASPRPTSTTCTAA